MRRKPGSKKERGRRSMRAQVPRERRRDEGQRERRRVRQRNMQRNMQRTRSCYYWNKQQRKR